MIKFLLDANISPETRFYLADTFGFDVVDLISENKAYLTDEEVVVLAKRERRVIITFDLDFGEIYHFKKKGGVGVIILRLDDQTVASVNRTLSYFFENEGKKINLHKSLVVLESDRIRIY